MKNANSWIASLAAAVLLGIGTSASAQPGPGGGPGMGPGQGAGQGMGPGMGQGGGWRQGGPGWGGRGGCRFAFNRDNTRGWSLMTQEERAAHRERMWSAKTYAECKAAQEENHNKMSERARAEGKTLPNPRWNACDRMRARGFFD